MNEREEIKNTVDSITQPLRFQVIESFYHKKVHKRLLEKFDPSSIYEPLFQSVQGNEIKINSNQI